MASASPTSRSTAATASGFFKSSASERRPRLRKPPFFSTSNALASLRPLRSMRITSAPMSASSMAANGAGPMPAISMILNPANGPMTCSSFYINQR